MNKKELMPIGSVVMLNDAVKRLMIIGYGQQENNEQGKGKVWDYVGCLFPEGYISPEHIFLFDHEQIQKKYHIGHFDEEQEAFNEKLKEAFSEINSNGE